jgi:hypothetical protein
MKEADIREEVYNLLRRLWYWPITQTDLNAPFDISAVNHLVGMLIGMTKTSPKTQAVVFQLKAVLDKAVARPPKGRPDILVLYPTRYGTSIVVEVKTLNLTQKKSFAFTKIDNNQRVWLDRWDTDSGLGYLALGTVGVPRGERKLWLIPWGAWMKIEGCVKKYQQSIPYKAGPGFKKELQERHLDLVTQLQRFELVWREGCWHADSKHHRDYLWPKDHLLERKL